MTMYNGTVLVTSGEAPFDASDIRERLNLLDPSFDKRISAVIGAKLAKGRCGRNGEVWSVPRGDDLAAFLAAVNKIGKLAKIGPAYNRHGTICHDCEYAADPVAVAKAFHAVFNWCWDDVAISNAILGERRGSFRPARVQHLEAAE